MKPQQMLLDFTPAQVIEQALQRGVDHANSIDPVWSEAAFRLLLQYLKENPTFMCEQFRSFALKQNFASPPDPRTWGAIIRRAAKENYITKLGNRPTKNKEAHYAIAGVWERNDAVFDRLR